MAQQATIKTVKAALRKKYKAKVAAIPKAIKDAHSRILAQLFLDLPKVQESRRFSIYLSRDDEVDTTFIIQTLLKEKKDIFVPFYKGDLMKMVPLYSWQDYERMPETAWKIKQPEDGERRADALHLGGLEVLVCPGLAFTETGSRLGRGKGYYDRYIQNCRTAGCYPFVVGFAFDEQMSEDDLALEENDELMSTVLYPSMNIDNPQNHQGPKRSFLSKTLKYTFPY